ncbi:MULTISPECIES: anthranilate phosphoribosyltransferase [unclassified Luteococcus]|uniref:anthranilate phosphoribosyltransferase n=1 Tax=unclassified Luteococcus TaxID=2639923 RepID=UPI00313A9D79
MASPTWPDLLTGLVEGRDLTAQQTAWAMDEILTGNAAPVHIAGFAVALRAKGETVEELRGLADAMTAHATPIDLQTEAVDIVGSGGDRANTVNVSTMAAVTAAAAGARVVKHGNRAASSMCGTADCLEALGVKLEVKPNRQAEVLERAGIVFLFAPLYHPSLRYAAGPRKELGIRTPFNLLGPLTNPARPSAQAIGVADPRAAELMAGVLAARGSRGLVFHGGDGLDELTTTTTSDVWLIRDGRVERTVLDPAELGLAPAQPQDLVGGPPEHNAQVARDVFAGQTGPVRDIVLANAAAALLAYRGVELDQPLAGQMLDCLADAARVLDDGSATALLADFVAATNA